jgi:hypothetical protein
MGSYEIPIHYIVLFVFIVISVLLGVYVCKKMILSNALAIFTKGGFVGKPQNVKNILIVDVANMYVGWYMEKHNKVMPHDQQTELMDGYISCMRDHYDRFVKINNTDTDVVNYVLKNYKYSQGEKNGMLAPIISKEIWEKIYKFVRECPGTQVTVAEDYTKINHSVWKSPKMHYLRGRDDYLCFRMAQHYKKKYINTVIMSDDKYRDYEQFGLVPEFSATFVHSKWGDASSAEPEIVQSIEHVKPKPNTLGQIKDYSMVKITMDFDFADTKFIKSSDYMIAIPGHVWD